jgi:glycine/D-amino acid oxidase-like deaminating enzyme
MGDAGTSPVVCDGPAGLPSPNPTKSFWQTSHPNPITHHRSTPNLPARASVVVVGTGISGTFATDELLRQSSSDVLVLEARTTCSAATGRNGGHLHPMIHSERSGIIDFELANYRHVASLVKDNDVSCDFRAVSGCVGFWNRAYFEDAKAALNDGRQTASRHRHLVQVVEDDDRLTQTLRLKGGVVGAFVQDIAASLSPYKLMVWMWQDMLRQHPERLNLQTETPVSSIEQTKDSWVLHTPRGTVRADRVILATNGYTSHLLPEFEGLISPTQAQMSALLAPAGSPFVGELIPNSYGFMGVGHDSRVMTDYLVQNPITDKAVAGGGGGHLMFGGGRAHAQGHGENVGDDSYVDPATEKYLRSLGERLDLADGQNENNDASALMASKSDLLELVASWTGIIGSSADGHPWVGGVPDREGLFLCAAYSGHGMTNAGLCGRHVARLALADSRGGWRDVEARDVDMAERLAEATAAGDTNKDVPIGVPREYVLTRQRMEAALGRLGR